MAVGNRHPFPASSEAVDVWRIHTHHSTSRSKRSCHRKCARSRSVAAPSSTCTMGFIERKRGRTRHRWRCIRTPPSHPLEGGTMLSGAESRFPTFAIW